MKPILLDLADTAAAVSLSTGNVQKLVREGNFPKPRALSTRRVGWMVIEVEAWAASLPVADMLPPPTRRKSQPS
ncbi:helix-turn-helix transcriptional regulator [Paraburkholderia tropica]|uniref:helix-turn-helix transcriptional regulator n=1 Tax=Paraburkholderia tropica TaxID=92647 RepID=UPI002AB1A858|nr:AlpA family phage regulatory protein [Paraburkholderia tropica]